jgi:uncharacterized protein (TIGR02594 family)
MNCPKSERINMTDPKWLAEARRLVGTREVPGGANNPVIMAWGNRLGAKVLGIAYTGDSVPWCGLFVAHCVTAAGLKPPPIAIRAKAWGGFGTALSTTATRPPLGAVAVFSREGGGHVGFVVGVHQGGDLSILGGNQKDEVNVRRFPRIRLSALRWPAGVPLADPAPWIGGPGVKTTGEA